jgi:asparagine synthase (glutamine-hydrolysing)
LKEMVDDLLSETRVSHRGLFRPEVVSRFVNEQREGTQDWSMQIWQFLTLELWMQAFLDGAVKQTESFAPTPQVASA